MVTWSRRSRPVRGVAPVSPGCLNFLRKIRRPSVAWAARREGRRRLPSRPRCPAEPGRRGSRRAPSPPASWTSGGRPTGRCPPPSSARCSRRRPGGLRRSCGHLRQPHATFYTPPPRPDHQLLPTLRGDRSRAGRPLPGQQRAHPEQLRRLRQEYADLRRTLHLYEEAIRQLALESDALRRQARVIPLPGNGSRPARP